MKFRIGDIVTLSFAHNLPTDPPQIATVTNLDTKHGENIVELMFPDGYNDTYWEDQVVLLSRQDVTETVLRNKRRRPPGLR